MLDDPRQVRALALASGPYWPVYRYFGDAVEASATGAPVADAGAPLRVPPWFRQDWAHDRPLVEGVEPILASERFRAAARALYGLDGAAIVRPQLVYANLMLPMPAADPGHVDVPAFRGIDREHHPVWLLSIMGHSGLFEAWRIRIATAVSWWYGGPGGAFTCWPGGADAPPRVVPAEPNTAIVGENERMFHRVEAVGSGEVPPGLDALGREAQLLADGDAWQVVEGGAVRARVPLERVRISVSWKAVVLADADEARRVDEHLDDLDLERVWSILAGDLRRRGIDAEPGADPLRDPAWIGALGAAYRRAPTCFPEASA